MAPPTPCLWFNGNAGEAVDFYLSVFPNSSRDAAGAPEGADGPADETVMVSFTIDGAPFLALNGGADFPFTPAVSFFISCETQVEVDRYWELLGDGGEPGRCGWITDRFGVSWQIVPTRLGELMSGSDEAATARVFEAMLQMSKLDIADLEAAAIS